MDSHVDAESHDLEMLPQWTLVDAAANDLRLGCSFDHWQALSEVTSRILHIILTHNYILDNPDSLQAPWTLILKLKQMILICCHS